METKKYFSVTIYTLWIICGLWALPGCGIYTEISVTSDASADFSKYRTFAWLPDDFDTANSPYNNEIIRNNLKNYFGQSFATRGFSVNLDTPDVLLQIVIINKEREKEVFYSVYPAPYYYCQYYYCSNYYSPYQYDYYYRHSITFCYGMGYCKQKIQYVEGSITLNMIDRKQNKLIWAATAKGDIYDPAYINKSIHPAVTGIMKKFPVKQIERKKRNSGTDDIFSANTSTHK
ncbi:MAG: DUF4136 domain-containing protein [Bacteroidia bacterium]